MVDQMMSETIGEIASALCKAQACISPIPKEANNPFYKSNYADLQSIWVHSKKACEDYGIAVTQIIIDEDDKSFLHTILMHSSGEWIKSKYDICAPGDKRTGGAVSPQSKGAAITYARRYSLSAILGNVTGEQDDDFEEGMKHAAPKKVTPKIVPLEPKKDAFESDTVRQQTKGLMLDSIDEAKTNEEMDELAIRYKPTIQSLAKSGNKLDTDMLNSLKRKSFDKRELLNAENNDDKEEQKQI
jgi:hypothetical protein